MLEWIWPSECAGCETRGWGRFCPSCLPAPAREVRLLGALSPRCFALASYHDGLGRALGRAKGGPDRTLTVALSKVFADGYGAHLSGFSAIVPTPTHWRRQVRRGFSPPAIFARALSGRSGVSLVYGLGLRSGPAQSTLDRVRRQRNLSGRVRARRPLSGRVVLVDDVVTTGATLDACSRALMAAGASEVVALVLCATPRADLTEPFTQSQDASRTSLTWNDKQASHFKVHSL